MTVGMGCTDGARQGKLQALPGSIYPSCRRVIETTQFAVCVGVVQVLGWQGCYRLPVD